MKYSYLVKGINDAGVNGMISIPRGTCFFYEKNSEYYLITGDHVILQQHFSGTPTSECDSFVIRSCNAKNQFCLSIDVKEYRKQKGRKPLYGEIDIFIMKVSVPKNVKLNPINKFIDNFNRLDVRPDSICGFGFPDSSSRGDYYNNNLGEVPPILFVAKTYKNFFDPIPYTDRDIIDSHIYAVSPRIMDGNSGAPTFAFYSIERNGENKALLQFGGMVTGKNPGKGFSIITRPETLISEIKRMIK